MSKKKTPPSYTDPGGPRIVDTHSYMLSPLGPALENEQFILHSIKGVKNRVLGVFSGF